MNLRENKAGTWEVLKGKGKEEKMEKMQLYYNFKKINIYVYITLFLEKIPPVSKCSEII